MRRAMRHEKHRRGLTSSGRQCERGFLLGAAILVVIGVLRWSLADDASGAEGAVEVSTRELKVGARQLGAQWRAAEEVSSALKEEGGGRRETGWLRRNGNRKEVAGDGQQDVQQSEGDPDVCDRNRYAAAWELKSDQLTILMNGFAEARLPLLQKHVRLYSAMPIVDAIYILWGNTSTPSDLLDEIVFESLGAPIFLVRQETTSLNDRFLPRSYIRTRAVVICDDDITVEAKSLGFALDVWRQDQDRIVGFFPRSHAYELDSRSWIYIKHQGRYSIMLTKLMIIATEYLYLYTCEMPPGVKAYVDEGKNCEDIAMNFLVSSHSGKGPLLVQGKPRDWGDTRNSDDRLSSAALSGRHDHRKDRGDCIKAFHKFWNGMELRFSYTKAVSDLEGLVLCEKFGYSIDCDKHVGSQRDARRFVGENKVSLAHRYAYATYMPSDSYLNTSLLLAQSVRSSGSVHDLVLLVDSSCSSIRTNHVLHEHYDEVVVVQSSQGADDMNQLGKLSAWLLTDYAKVVYLEIDSLVLVNIDHLFRLPELAAAPRVFMPGMFSTGLLVLKPSNETYAQLVKSLDRIRMLHSKRRQYLLNSCFSGWFQMPTENRLPARYNAPVVFSKQLKVPVWFDVNRAYEVLGPIMVARYGNAKLSSKHVDPYYGIVNTWCVSRFKLFEALQDNHFHPLDDDNLTAFDWLPFRRWNSSDMMWPPRPGPTSTDFAFTSEKVNSKEAFVTVLWGNQAFPVAGWAESYYRHHSLPSHRKTVLIVLETLDPASYSEYSEYFDEVKVVAPFAASGRATHGSFALLHLWNQTGFEKVVYVASTSLFVDNCNSLLDYEPFAAVPSIFPPDLFSTEVMVVQPNQNTFSILTAKLGGYELSSQPVDLFLNAHHDDWYQMSPSHRITPSYSVNMAFDAHLQNAARPWKVLSFTLEWLPDEAANVTKVWREVVCDLKPTAKKPETLKSLCEAVGDESE